MLKKYTASRPLLLLGLAVYFLYMRGMIFSHISTLLFVILCMAFICPTKAHCHESEAVRHDLAIILEPELKTLRGKDTIRIARQNTGIIELRLAARARIIRVSLNGASQEYQREKERILVALPATLPQQEYRLEVEYECVFDAPVPDDPASMDSTDMGARAVIAEQGAFLPASSGWYPRLTTQPQAFTLRVDAPKGMYAATMGRFVEQKDTEARSLSTWEIRNAYEGLSLSAGYYVVEQNNAATPVYTFFSANNAQLSPRYLEASARHVAFYDDLHGPYPFSKFAVVENFFPTGYGFPSYTLLGGTVLRLPFIPETSLRHEVAHCWWGNGVFVDYAQGNWCEGLTSYVADYLAKERRSPEAGLEYRLKTLRNFALLVSEAKDFPLSRFRSRSDPASRAIGYGKALYVFHMLRQRVGDARFWEVLRRVYAQRCFLETSWDDFARAFVGADFSQEQSIAFFEQWVRRSGAPKLFLKNVRMEQKCGGWELVGTLEQTEPTYALRVPVHVETESGEISVLVDVRARATSFTVASQNKPTRVVVDPEAHIFRKLFPAEIPSTVNTVKGAKDLTAIYSSNLPIELFPALERLLKSLHQGQATIVMEKELAAAQLVALKGKNVLLYGYPATRQARELLPAMQGVSFSEKGATLAEPLAGQLEQEPDTVFLVASRPGQEGVVALLALSNNTLYESFAKASRKLTHYGSYSCLGFVNGNNILRYTWSPVSSSLNWDVGL